jgi:lipopolysaccharide biosynthesis glycosyltransferase
MDIIFCADRKVLPGLHVAAWSLLERVGLACLPLRFHLFSDQFDETDANLLRATLDKTGKPYDLKLHTIDPSLFQDFPPLNGSWATYYRLHAATVVEADRFLYVDADTLCDIDISPLMDFDFAGKPAAWVPEAPLAHAVDRKVAEELGNSADIPYFNAGVILINGPEWKRQKISERAMNYLAESTPAFWDQSALNMVLHQNSVVLDERFNTIANMRKHWPVLCMGYGNTGSLIHFLDYPKPWDFLGEWVCPFHAIWHEVLQRTVFAGFRSWKSAPSRRIPTSMRAMKNYKKSVKDRLILTAYKRGFITRLKGAL